MYSGTAFFIHCVEGYNVVSVRQTWVSIRMHP